MVIRHPCGATKHTHTLIQTHTTHRHIHTRHTDTQTHTHTYRHIAHINTYTQDTHTHTQSILKISAAKGKNARKKQKHKAGQQRGSSEGTKDKLYKNHNY